MENAPARRPATPARTITLFDTPAPATPMINDTLDTSPSFAPKMAARSAPDLSAVRCSVAIGPGCGTILHCRPRTRRTIEESIETRALVFRSSGERPEPMSTGYEMAETGARVRVFVLHGPLGCASRVRGKGVAPCELDGLKRPRCSEPSP